MPLGFHSLSHGVVPFGFFNVASDLLILGDHFAFAAEMCEWFGSWATQLGSTTEVSEGVSMWVIDDPRRIGDLGGAIRGTDFRGLIGRSYELFPFPVQDGGFKQDPDCHRTRPVMEALLTEFAGSPRSIPVTASSRVSIGAYVFDADGFVELVLYLWRGGMPRWRDDIRPSYVLQMMERVRASGSSMFRVHDLNG